MLPYRIFAGFAMAAFLTPALAQTVDLPMRKEGLWQMSTTVSGAPATVSTLCMDKSFGKEMLQMGSSMQKEMCSKNDISRDGDKVHLHSVCKFGDTTELAAYLARGERTVRHWQATHHPATAYFDAAGFVNFNRPEDLGPAGAD